MDFDAGQIYTTLSGGAYYVISRNHRSNFDWLLIQGIDRSGHLIGERKQVFVRHIREGDGIVEVASLKDTDTIHQEHCIRADRRM